MGKEDKASPTSGYGKPPVASRFRKGQSGNPKGRPRGRRNPVPYDAVLGQYVTVRENGVERRITADRAFLLYFTKVALEKGGYAARTMRAEIEEAMAKRGPSAGKMLTIVRKGVTPGSVLPAMEPLRMVTRLDRYRPTARSLLEPWLVEAALQRMGDRRLTLEEQTEVVRNVRAPHKVRWPDWWEVTADGW